jgi:hypothetical protein
MRHPPIVCPPLAAFLSFFFFRPPIRPLPGTGLLCASLPAFCCTTIHRLWLDEPYRKLPPWSHKRGTDTDPERTSACFSQTPHSSLSSCCRHRCRPSPFVEDAQLVAACDRNGTRLLHDWTPTRSSWVMNLRMQPRPMERPLALCISVADPPLAPGKANPRRCLRYSRCYWSGRYAYIENRGLWQICRCFRRECIL